MSCSYKISHTHLAGTSFICGYFACCWLSLLVDCDTCTIRHVLVSIHLMCPCRVYLWMSCFTKKNLSVSTRETELHGLTAGWWLLCGWRKRNKTKNVVQVRNMQVDYLIVVSVIDGWCGLTFMYLYHSLTLFCSVCPSIAKHWFKPFALSPVNSSGLLKNRTASAAGLGYSQKREGYMTLRFWTSQSLRISSSHTNTLDFKATKQLVTFVCRVAPEGDSAGMQANAVRCKADNVWATQPQNLNMRQSISDRRLMSWNTSNFANESK